MKKAIRIINYICVLIMIAVLVMQFMPFWTCPGCRNHTEPQQVSIVDYTWFPEHHKTITREMTDVYLEEYGEDYLDEKGKAYKFTVDDIVTGCVVVLISGAVGVFLCAILSKKAFVTWIPLLCGVTGVVDYLTMPAMKIGINNTAHLVVLAVLAVTALVGVVLGFVNWFKTKSHNYSLKPLFQKGAI